jgi:hypothetical protein
MDAKNPSSSSGGASAATGVAAAVASVDGLLENHLFKKSRGPPPRLMRLPVL